MEEVTTQSWFKRIGNSLIGLIIGLALIIGSFLLIFWNESRSLHTTQSLEQAEKVIVPVASSPVDPKNNMQVVYFSGLATTEETLSDPLLGYTDKAIRFERIVEMYQWKEKQNTRTEKQVGGSEKQITNYTYNKVWSDRVIDSATFKDASGHQNPATMPFQSHTEQATKVTVGDFLLPQALVDEIANKAAIDLSQTNLEKIKAKTKQNVQAGGSEIYIGADSKNPEIGDVRITLWKVIPQEVSVIAQQTGNTLQPYVPKAGWPVMLLSSGQVSSAQMILDAHHHNRLMTSIWRFVSFILMVVGFALILNPLVIIADVVPFIGNIVRFGTFTISLAMGLLFWAIGTALAWFLVRPLLAILLVLGAIIICFILFKAARKKEIPNKPLQ